MEIAKFNPALKVLNAKIKRDAIESDLEKRAASISALKSGKIEKYEFLTDSDILPRSIDQKLAEKHFEYTPLGQAFRRQYESTESQGKILESMLPKKRKKVR